MRDENWLEKAIVSSCIPRKYAFSAEQIEGWEPQEKEIVNLAKY